MGGFGRGQSLCGERRDQSMGKVGVWDAESRAPVAPRGLVSDPILLQIISKVGER